MLEAIFTENVLTVTLAGLYQWDYGQKLYIKGLELGETEQIHFSNTKEKEAIVMPLVKNGEHYVCDIPNELLEKWWDITAWVYDVGEKSGETVRTIILKIEQRVKPQDFISTNPDATEILGDVLNKIDKNINDNAVFKDDISKQQESFTTTMTQEHAQHKQEVTDYVNAKLNGVYLYKGSKPTFQDLPKSGNTVGDVWNVLDTGMNYAWTGTEWDGMAGIVDLSQYYKKSETYNRNEVDNKVDNAVSNIKSTVKAITLLASGWVGNQYTINDSLVTLTSNQKVMRGLTMTEEQTNAYYEAKLSEVGQSSGQMVIKASGTVPTIDIPIRVMFSMTLLESPRASDKVTLATRNDTGDSIKFGVDSSGNYGYIPQGSNTVSPFGVKYELNKEIKTNDVWIDGSPIFMRVIKLSNSGNTKVYSEVLPVNEWVSLRGIIKINYSGGIFYATDIYVSGSNSIRIHGTKDKKIELNSDVNMSSEATVIAKYTKEV